MSKAAMNLQDSFLNQVRRENSEVRVLLVNGTLLRGTVKGFDNFTLILNDRNGQHLVYKHAIAQIVTQRPHIKPEDAATQSTGESAGDQSEKPVAAAAGAPHQAQPRQAQDKPRSQKSKPKKDGFNTLDLSQVKLGEKP